MKTVKITLSNGKVITLVYRPGYRFHPDLEAGRIVSPGRFYAKDERNFGFMHSVSWDGAGHLTYLFQKITKDGRLRQAFFSVQAEEIPDSFKASGLQMEVITTADNFCKEDA